MARLELVSPDIDDPILNPIFDKFRDAGHEPPDLYRVLANAPAMLKAWVDLAWPLRLEATTSRALRELIIMRVAVLTDAAFEWEAHWPAALPSRCPRGPTGGVERLAVVGGVQHRRAGCPPLRRRGGTGRLGVGGGSRRPPWRVQRRGVRRAPADSELLLLRVAHAPVVRDRRGHRADRRWPERGLRAAHQGPGPTDRRAIAAARAGAAAAPASDPISHNPRCDWRSPQPAARAVSLRREGQGAASSRDGGRTPA